MQINATSRRSSDTSADIQSLVDGRVLSMSPAEKAAVVAAITRDCTRLVVADIRAETPDITDAELRYRLAQRRYGTALAAEAYPAQA